MRLGFLFGSFDPIHNGHIGMISSCLLSKVVDEIYIVPTLHNPWKKNEPTSFDLRCKMIQASIQPFGNKVHLSSIEELIQTDKEPAYTYKDCEWFYKKFQKDDLFIIGGTDVVAQIPKWKQFNNIIQPHFGVIHIFQKNIPHSEVYMPFAQKITHGDFPMGYFEVIAPIIGVSSSFIRNIIQNGESTIIPYVSENVSNIIKINHLYECK